MTQRQRDGLEPAHLPWCDTVARAGAELVRFGASAAIRGFRVDEVSVRLRTWHDAGLFTATASFESMFIGRLGRSGSLPVPRRCPGASRAPAVASHAMALEERAAAA